VPQRRSAPLGLIAVLLSTLITVPGPVVQAQLQEQELTLHRQFTVNRVNAVDVRRLSRLSLAGRTRGAARKAIRHLVHNRRLHERAKTLNSHEAMKAKHAWASPSHPPRTSTGSGQGPDAVTGAPISGLFESLACGCEPPDTQVAADSNYLFEAVNTAGLIADKAGNVLALFDLHAFIPGEGPGFFISDPKVRFDPLSGVWFFSIISVSGAPDGSGLWWLGVSQPSDPFHWTIYNFEGVAGTFPDFDGLGISDDKVVLTANAFSSDTTFVGAEVLVLSKTELEAGMPSLDGALFVGSRFFTIQPANALSATGGPLYMASADPDNSQVYHVFSILGTPPGAVSISVTNVPLDLVNVGSLNTPPGAAQGGTSTLIETNDNRVLDVVYRDGHIWVTANDGCLDASSNFLSCVRLTQIDTAQMVRTQDLDLGEAGGNFYYGAIQVVPDPNIAGTDDLIAVFTESNPSDFPSVMASGRVEAVDPPNTLRAPVLIQPGLAPYAGNRWGDYSGAGADPSSALSGTAWVAGEYTTQDGEWGTAIVNVAFTCSPCF